MSAPVVDLHSHVIPPGMVDLLCMASLARLPQLTIPVGTAEGCQVGLSLVGGRATDRALLGIATRTPFSQAPLVSTSHLV